MKLIKAAIISITVSTSGVASAGIPVADGIQLAQNIAMSMAEQMMHEALAQARNQLSEKLAQKGMDFDEELAGRAEDFAWEMYEETTKKYGYGWNYEVGSSEIYRHMETYTDEATKNQNAKTMEESLANYKTKVDAQYRKKNGMESEQAHIQKAMDKDLTWKVMVDNTLGEVNERHAAIKALRARADGAITPQEKTDLQIAIGIEQNAINNEMMRMQVAAEAQALEQKTERHRLNKDVREAYDNITFKVE